MKENEVPQFVMCYIRCLEEPTHDISFFFYTLDPLHYFNLSNEVFLLFPFCLFIANYFEVFHWNVMDQFKAMYNYEVK